jgi:hypothetical protein
MTTTRRNLLKFAGGSVVGALFTPAPWRLITDTALWSENWPGIPRPLRGEARQKFTHCTLCPSGCAMRARCIGEQPIALAGLGGGLCPFGVGGHHLPYSPGRAVGQAAPPSLDLAAGNVAILDPRPGRTASWTYRRAMAAVGGTYIAAPQPAVAVNLENAKTVLSLGAPLLDGWIAPAKAFAARERFHLIQAEPVESRTGAVADEWLPIRPGSEDALALALAGAMPLDQAAEATGVRQETIENLRRQLNENGPALVVDAHLSPNVVALNIALGGWGRTILPRAEAPVPAEWKKAAPATALNEVADRSIGVLLIDESLPGYHPAWTEIRPKLADSAVVVVFGWSREGYGRYAPHFVPAPVFPEAADDVPAGVDSAAPSFRLAPALAAARAGVVNPAEFVAKAAGLAATDALRERADAIHAAGRGTLTTYADGNAVPVKDVSADDFWKALSAGASWTGEAEKPGAAPKPEFANTRTGAGNVVVSEELPFASPLMSKVYQESNLRLARDSVAVNPADARTGGIEDGAQAIFESAGAVRKVRVRIDGAVRPGIVQVASPEFTGAQAKVVRL